MGDNPETIQSPEAILADLANTHAPRLFPELPRYQALAELIGRRVSANLWCPGSRLPTHRSLAKAIGVTVGTVTRAYAEAEKRGWITGQVGRGTFVRPHAPGAVALSGNVRGKEAWGSAKAQTTIIEMSLNTPPVDPEDAALLQQTLANIAQQDNMAQLLTYQPNSALPAHREAGAGWIHRTGYAVDASNVLLTSGSQHALQCALRVLLTAGDRMLCANLTYPGIRAHARNGGYRIEGLATDKEGILPSALEEACALQPTPKLLYLVPTLQNPTGATMSPARRQRIAELCERHDLWLVEDDVHAALTLEPQLPIATWLPHRTIYLASLAKSLSIGLRIGYLAAPTNLLARLQDAIRASLWMPPPLMGEVSKHWASLPIADEILNRRHQSLAKRHAIVSAHLPIAQTKHQGLHCWLPLPAPWRAESFVDQAHQRGVRLVGSRAFAVGKGHPLEAVRLSLGAADMAELEVGAATLAVLLQESPGDVLVAV